MAFRKVMRCSYALRNLEERLGERRITSYVTSEEMEIRSVSIALEAVRRCANFPFRDSDSVYGDHAEELTLNHNLRG